ncbi:MAG: hypothetical protein MUC46_08455 [Desulfobacterales bacterium]|nr:hypothetical protein [Desulfobacterales bacterium]
MELIAGRTVQVDERNRYFFGGEIRSETIKGWGFPRHIVSRLGPMAGTKIAVDPTAPKVDRFVTLGGEPSWWCTPPKGSRCAIGSGRRNRR